MSDHADSNDHGGGEDLGSYLPPGLPEPAPYADGLAAEFWEATRRHELVVQRCRRCRTWQWGPEHICHHCHSFDLAYERVTSWGRIYSWERSWYPVHPALTDAVPYLTVLVERAGGRRAHGGEPAG